METDSHISGNELENVRMLTNDEFEIFLQTHDHITSFKRAFK